MTWQATVLTIFPEMLPGPLGHSLAGKALRAALWRLETVDIRDFARDKHRSVDDAPFGGGPGMVMRPDVLDAAIEGCGGVGPVILLSPRGRQLDQRRVHTLAAGTGVTMICGRFEGVDERLLEARAVEELSLGDFVLSGGEPAAIAVIDACVRLLPGVVGDSPAGYCSAECAACRTWYDLHNKLHEELRLKPWQWLCLPRNPYPPGTAASRNWRADPDGEKQALWQLLGEARRCQLQHQSG